MATNERVSAGLNGLLADATIFYQKLRHYHWNVEGRAFFELHAKFETLYTRWATAIDEIAERILMIGGVPLHTLTSMLKEARLVEDEGIPSAAEMVDAVLTDLAALHARAGDVIALAEKAEDRGTENALDTLRDDIEKDLWMLRAWSREAARTCS